jgi:hypothetical protein
MVKWKYCESIVAISGAVRYMQRTSNAADDAVRQVQRDRFSEICRNRWPPPLWDGAADLMLFVDRRLPSELLSAVSVVYPVQFACEWLGRPL